MYRCKINETCCDYSNIISWYANNSYDRTAYIGMCGVVEVYWRIVLIHIFFSCWLSALNTYSP